MLAKLDKNKKLRKYIYCEGQLLKQKISIECFTKTVYTFCPNFFISRVKNSCCFSGKVSSVFSIFKISRTIVKQIVYTSCFSLFCKKQSWLFFSFYGESGRHDSFKNYCIFSVLVQIQLKVYFLC